MFHGPRLSVHGMPKMILAVLDVKAQNEGFKRFIL